MTRSKQATIKIVKTLSQLRPEIDEQLLGKPNVIGSMLGLKYKAGRLTKQLGITYFVRKKVSLSALDTQHSLPKKLDVQGESVTTDVLVWPHMSDQASLPQGTILFDGRLQGTLSCFALSQVGVFGVSCAHCLTGVDQNPATPTPIQAYSNTLGDFFSVGESVYLAYSPGIGASDNFGYLDCGIFDLRDNILLKRASEAQPLAVVTDIHSLVDSQLRGVSALNAPGSVISQRKAKVVGVEAKALGERCDVVLNVEPPGTFRGDSGMLWLTHDGRAAAIHARGEIMAGMQGSRLTTAMSAKRVALALGVQLMID